MKRIGKTAIALTTGGALALGGIAVAAPVLAGAGPGGPGGPPAASQTAEPRPPGAGGGAGQGLHHGMGQFQRGPGDRACMNLTAPSGTVTAAQKTALAAQAEEEKLTHDLYTAFAARYDARVFDQIAKAESNHLSAVRTLLDRYGISDPTEGKSAGQFASADVKAEYDRLLAQGSANERAALQAGAAEEKAQIATLKQSAQGVKAADVKQVYDRLIATSQRHLSAFQSWGN
ncbi:ferritin-like domain-containing protein [Actinomadura latina]|uniref:DUF2202 domain-containing protein n=1 Tax=Actinomadura latina TaxID=163603 RepID=A0A846Z3W3_9ACTN|nr:DUF2202 domain-containing protein [Actinomadura latina]NKZ05454.1 DUF2202 domain-containing protein [Actinomadura latina]